MSQWQQVTEGSGQFSLQVQGPRVEIQVKAREQEKGLYKAWLLGTGEPLLLGTLLPAEGKQLYLKRVITLDQLRRGGLWPVTGVKVGLAFPVAGETVPRGWQWMEHPERLTEDAFLQQLLQGQGRALCRQEAKGYVLAYPYDSHRAFPLCPLFCFAKLSPLEGHIFCCIFLESGWPKHHAQV